MTSVYDKSKVDLLAKSLRIGPHELRRFRNALLKKSEEAVEALRSIPDDVRAEFAANLRFNGLVPVLVSNSSRDGSTKVLFQTVDGAKQVETVILRIGSGRTTLCVSSQVGCAAGCTFCATGYLGLARNLTSDEIVDQVAHANRLLHTENRQLRNVVFMGMGEPFHNEGAVSEAVDTLIDPTMFDFEPRRITVSTVGIPDAMVRFARRFPTVGLAISLHSADPDVRERLIPVSRRYTLADLKRAMREVHAIQKRPPMVEYLMLEGINDSSADAVLLLEFLCDLNAHINLVPFNPIDDAPEIRSSNESQIAQFAGVLREAGFVVTVRQSLGGDLGAACGQLALRSSNQVTRSIPAAEPVAIKVIDNCQ